MWQSRTTIDTPGDTTSFWLMDVVNNAVELPGMDEERQEDEIDSSSW